ncbi:HlyD family secretion protein [Saccharospirillum salsuginis]|uniref:Multidrug resistance protein A n=1 Tax=Saccharospirillum salsuginis TaxID=418750 RepID=A0A918N8I1_9GAMM|nr:efflux RND transporter periplasmic adaptor subunit [Saccharospirillum salsuginis]GGX53928.1 multidrug resistance protein A [Saccharospirillum salsuginis]
MNNKAMIFSLVYLCGLGGVLGYGYMDQMQAPEPVLQGTVDARTVRISAKLAGRVSELSVREGDRLAVGDPVFELSSPELDARLRQARAAVAAKSAMSQRAERGARQEELAQARDQWQRARAAFELAEKTAGRVRNLHDDGLVSQQRLDEAETRAESARLAAEAARQQYVQAQNGTEDELKAAAASETDAAKGALDEVRALLAETHMTAPAAGEVTEVLVHPGEIAPAGFPVVTLTDLNDSWVRFHVREDRLDDFKPGQAMSGYVPALDQTIELTVSYVSPLGEYATWRATHTGEADLRTFEVRALPTTDRPDWRAGMSVLLSTEPDHG